MFANCQRVARSLSLTDLQRVNAAVNADLIRDMSAGVTGTQAHVGLVELAQATADEMVRRDYATLIPIATEGK